MTYENIEPGIFLARPNRFTARVLIRGRETVCHVKNTGRCRELLLPGASILVYALGCTREQKAGVLARVEQINREGSAYNMIGLVFKFSHKPNIMFCSQFVYRMLELEGLAYFTKGDGDVKPTDLVELDYHRKLAFVTEIRFGEAHSRLPTG